MIMIRFANNKPHNNVIIHNVTWQHTTLHVSVTQITLITTMLKIIKLIINKIIIINAENKNNKEMVYPIVE